MKKLFFIVLLLAVGLMMDVSSARGAPVCSSLISEEAGTTLSKVTSEIPVFVGADSFINNDYGAETYLISLKSFDLPSNKIEMANLGIISGVVKTATKLNSNYTLQIDFNAAVSKMNPSEGFIAEETVCSSSNFPHIEGLAEKT